VNILSGIWCGFLALFGLCSKELMADAKAVGPCDGE
jgi:hypothetical protein